MYDKQFCPNQEKIHAVIPSSIIAHLTDLRDRSTVLLALTAGKQHQEGGGGSGFRMPWRKYTPYITYFFKFIHGVLSRSASLHSGCQLQPGHAVRQKGRCLFVRLQNDEGEELIKVALICAHSFCMVTCCIKNLSFEEICMSIFL